MSSSANRVKNDIPGADEEPRSFAPRINGLLLGLLLAVITVALAAAGINAAPGSIDPPAAASATQTAAVSYATATASAGPHAAPTATRRPVSTPTIAIRTATPSASPTEAVAATITPAEAPDTGTDLVLGYSVENRPITAHRIGDGAIKIALVADIHGGFEANTHLLAQQLLEHFSDHPEEVPAGVSLWIVPTMNPDGLAAGYRWNARGVDLNRNADTDLDGCGSNDWAPDTYSSEGLHPGAGGSFPFSEPETRAIRDFLADASIAVFYHSAAEAIFVDSCQRHLPTARLAEALSLGSGYRVPEEGWSGYPITGDLGDYLAGEGIAAVALELTDHDDPEFERNLNGVRAVLDAADQIVSAEAIAAGAQYVSIGAKTTGAVRFAPNTFIHPIALAVLDRTVYLLDTGRIMAHALDEAKPPEVLLVPGDYVENIRVLEPLDLAADETSLLALDRAGDVYRYSPASETWTLERYDRPAGDTYDHYFVALDAGPGANYLLETTHEQIWQFASGQRGVAWARVPQGRDVDLSASEAGTYVLTRHLNSPLSSLLRFRDGHAVNEFKPNLDIVKPRQVVAGRESVYVLDRAGRRLLNFEAITGNLRALYQFPDRTAVSAIWVDPGGQQVILAGRDALYLLDQPEIQTYIEGGPVLQGVQPNDLDLLQTMRGFSSPIEGASLTTRDFQMPGAPRHYRLGVHEGIDFYGHTVGVTVNRNTPVHAVADGTVIRALVDYQPLTAAQADSWAAQTTNLGYTPAEVLDGYRGRQVWIDHGNGVISRYAHLSALEPGIVEGAQVTQGQVIARVGNSGTPSSLNSQSYDVHLHLELWVGDHFVGQFLRPIEAREWLERILR